jgi:hypothetical protein
MSTKLGMIVVVLCNNGEGYGVDFAIAKFMHLGAGVRWEGVDVPDDYSLPEWAQHAVAKLLLLPTDKTGFGRLTSLGTVLYSDNKCKVTVIVPNEHADMWSELL